MRFFGRIAVAAAAFSLIAPMDVGVPNLPGAVAHAADKADKSASSRSEKSSKSSKSDRASKSEKGSKSGRGGESKSSKSSKSKSKEKASRSARGNRGKTESTGRRAAARGLAAGGALAMTEAVAGDLPVVETPVTETPVVETPVTETPVTEIPVVETPVTETPVTETPVDETPVTETPAGETPVVETPVTETPVTETPTQVDGPIPDTPDSPETADGETEGEETPTQVDGPVPDDGATTDGETVVAETPTQVDGPTPDTETTTEETVVETPTATTGSGGQTANSGTGSTTGSGGSGTRGDQVAGSGSSSGGSSSGGSQSGGSRPGGSTSGGSSSGGSSTGGSASGGSDVTGGRTPDPVAEAPVTEVDGSTSSGKAPVRTRPAVVASDDSDDAPAATPPGLKGLLQSILGGRPRTPAGTGAVTAEAATATATPAVAPVAVAPTIAPTVAPVVTQVVTPVVTPKVAPVVAPVAASRAKVAVEPEIAKTAPRIELSSGGSRQKYRQHEITALGLTRESRQVANALGFRILSERKSALLGNQVVARLRTPSGQTADAALARIRSVLPEMTFDYSHLYRPSGEAGSAPVRYAAAMIGAPMGESARACSAGTTVGLIDSGVGAHPTLAGARVVRKNFVAKDAATNVTHGTAIASILVGDLPGSGPLLSGGNLYSANVFSQDGQGLRADPAAIIEALDWMAASGVPVVNLSLMGPDNDLLTQAIRAAAQRGLVLVAAAGNDGPGGAPAYPAAYPEVIAVSAVDSRGRPYARNNRGGYIYVAAPGVDVWGADARGGLAFWTGTSFAAPFVTASIARDLAQGRVRNINDGRKRLASTARDMGAPGRDPIYGYGLLQLSGCGAGGVAATVSSKSR
jgi:minor extracellular protease Epr